MEKELYGTIKILIYATEEEANSLSFFNRVIGLANEIEEKLKAVASDLTFEVETE